MTTTCGIHNLILPATGRCVECDRAPLKLSETVRTSIYEGIQRIRMDGQHIAQKLYEPNTNLAGPEAQAILMELRQIEATAKATRQRLQNIRRKQTIAASASRESCDHCGFPVRTGTGLNAGAWRHDNSEPDTVAQFCENADGYARVTVDGNPTSPTAVGRI